MPSETCSRISYSRSGEPIAASPGAYRLAGSADMILKVKEPLPQEYGLIREDHILFTYLHLAPAPELTQALLDATGQHSVSLGHLALKVRCSMGMVTIGPGLGSADEASSANNQNFHTKPAISRNAG